MRSIKFFRSETGVSPVEDFLNKLSDKTAKKVLAVFKIIENKELISSRFFKKLTGTDLWECRIMWESNIYRFLAFLDKNNIILTHGFQKKTQKTPSAEIKRAVKYMNEYRRRNIK